MPALPLPKREGAGARQESEGRGHNGLENILAHLRTQEVPRIRIGVGGARSGELIDHVLSRFRKEELPVIQAAYETAADAVECALAEGFETAMNRFNVDPKAADRRKAKAEASAPETASEARASDAA